MAMRPLLAVIVAVLPLTACVSVAGGDRPAFAGRWDCAGTRMTFTAATYTASGASRPIDSVETEERSITGTGEDYLITLAGGDRLTLVGVTDERMTWHSPQSGDTFDCERIR